MTELGLAERSSLMTEIEAEIVSWRAVEVSLVRIPKALTSLK